MNALEHIALASGSNLEMNAKWAKICFDAEREEKDWVQNLKDTGFKASHPNDGWVDRERDTVHLCYPHFDDGVAVGDLIMLGWPSDSLEKLKPVRVTEIIEGFPLRYAFEDIT